MKRSLQPACCALLVASAVTAGCQESIVDGIVALEDRYHLQVRATRSSYAPGDSGIIVIENQDARLYAWHRCPGVKVQRATAAAWVDVPSTDACTPGFVQIPRLGSITIGFVMPSTVATGRHRVVVALTADVREPLIFWWPGTEFTVTGPAAAPAPGPRVD